METRRTSLRDSLTDVAFQDISNASLWLDKFIAGQNRKDERTETSADKFKQQLITETAEIKTPDIYKSFYTRWKDSLIAVGAKFKDFKVEGRMVIGLGAESVLETSIALHRTYGVPFIAGGALKGLAASYADKNLEDKSWRKGGKAHEFVFGSQDSAGFICFHDALLIPETRNPLHADIMTVHHSDYYGDKSDGQGNRLPPADWDNPVPISFLSATGTYLVAISSVEGAEDWIKFIFAILGKALQEEGVGAKTSSGYGRGYFEKSKEDEAEEQEKLSIDGFVKRVNALKINDVAAQIGNFFQDWKNNKSSASLRRVAARAIIEKVREAGREKQSKGKAWFDELQNFVSEN